jgi:hypothetical protein
LHVGVFTGPAGTFASTSERTTATKAVLAALEITAPKKVLRLDPPTSGGPNRPGTFQVNPSEKSAQVSRAI